MRPLQIGVTRDTTARYAGRCERCKAEIRPGDHVLFYPASGVTYGSCCAAVVRTEMERLREAEAAKKPPTTLFPTERRRIL